MRIEDTGRYEWRKGQYAEAADVLGEATKSKGIDQATAFTIEMIDNLDRVKDHPDMTRELAEELITETVRIEIESRVPPALRIFRSNEVTIGLVGRSSLRSGHHERSMQSGSAH